MTTNFVLVRLGLSPTVFKSLFISIASFNKESNSRQYYIVHITMTITTTIIVVEEVLVSFLVFHKICLDQQLHFTWCSNSYHTATYIRSFTHIAWSCKYVIFTRNILRLDVHCDFVICCPFSPNPTFNIQVYYDMTESIISDIFKLKINLLFRNVPR